MKSYALIRQRRETWWSSKGFTLMEVLVGMVLIGISVTILLSLVADHLRLTGKIAERNKKVFYAIKKTEEACLGILEGTVEIVENKKIWSGKTDDGTPWKVVEQTSKENENTILYDVTVGGINLQGVGIQK